MRYRPWISLAIALHLFCMLISMSGNMSPSLLQQRLRYLLSPYLIGLNWYMDYVPLELTHGIETDGLWWIQIRDPKVSQDWTSITPTTGSYQESTHRIRQIARLTGLMTLQQRTDEASVLLAGLLSRESSQGRLPTRRNDNAPKADSATSVANSTEGRQIEIRILRQPVRSLEEVALANQVNAELDPLVAEIVFTARAIEAPDQQWLVISLSDPRRMVPVVP